MKSFLQYLSEMAYVHKGKVDMDAEDVSYLQQFPHRMWMQAIIKRYGDLLISALDASGHLRPDWEDVRDVSLKTLNGTYTFRANTFVRHLADKLASQGFELRHPDAQTNTALYYAPMAYGTANKIIWRAKSFPRGKEREFRSLEGKTFPSANPDIRPGFASWTPNRMQRMRADYVGDGPEQERQGEKLWGKIEAEARVDARTVWDRTLANASDPSHAMHLNYFFWRHPARQREAVEGGIRHVKQNLKRPEVATLAGRRGLLASYYKSLLQKGIAPRNSIERHGLGRMAYQTDPATGKPYGLSRLMATFDNLGRKYPDKPITAMSDEEIAAHFPQHYGGTKMDIDARRARAGRP